jgi:hypothetical protein
VIAVGVDTLALFINAERNGAGVPLAYAPPNATKDQIEELSALAQSYRAAESAGGSLPNGAEPGFRGVERTLPMFSPASATGDRLARHAFVRCSNAVPAPIATRPVCVAKGADPQEQLV